MKRTTKFFILIFALAFILSSFVTVASASDGEAEEGVFDMAYKAIYENADKIFAVLAFLGSLIIAYSYKKGLFPFVEKALAKLSGAVGTLKEETDKASLESQGFIAAISEKLGETEKYIAAFGEKFKTLEEKLEKAEALKGENEKFRAVMLAEVEMFYEIFISSSLPQYQKDRVGEAYTKMKSALCGRENADENNG